VLSGALTEAVATLLTRGQAAVDDIQRAPSAAGTAAADAFQQLQVIRELLELASSKQYDRVLQVGLLAACAACRAWWDESNSPCPALHCVSYHMQFASMSLLSVGARLR